MAEKISVSEVEEFDASKLKHVETVEKNELPNSDGKCVSPQYAPRS